MNAPIIIKRLVISRMHRDPHDRESKFTKVPPLSWNIPPRYFFSSTSIQHFLSTPHQAMNIALHYILSSHFLLTSPCMDILEMIDPIWYNAIVHACSIAKLAPPKISHFPFIYIPNLLQFNIFLNK